MVHFFPSSPLAARSARRDPANARLFSSPSFAASAAVAPVPLCIFPFVPSRSFARAYQQSILRTWECEMACPAMPAMLLESRCGRVDCLNSPIPLLPCLLFSPVSLRTHTGVTTHLNPPRSPPCHAFVCRDLGFVHDGCCTPNPMRDVPRTFSRSVYVKSGNAAAAPLLLPKVIFTFFFPRRSFTFERDNRPFRK